MKHQIRIRTLLAIIFIPLLFFSCGGGNKSAKIGEEAVVIKKCIAATTEESYDEMTKACVRKDEPKLVNMEKDGLIEIIYSNTDGTIRAAKLGKYQIEITKTGKRLWIASEFIKKK